MEIADRGAGPVRSVPSKGSLADVVETLAAVYEPLLGINTVVLVTRRCQRELEISGSSPKRLEPLARRRLQNLADTKGKTATQDRDI